MDIIPAVTFLLVCEKEVIYLTGGLIAGYAEITGKNNRLSLT